MVDENGQIQVSERELMSRWNWGSTKVRNFIDYLTQQSICKAETKQKKEEDTEIYKRIIDYLNMVCRTNYKSNNKQTKEHSYS